MSALIKFKEYLRKPDIKLISQIEVSEEEYASLLDYTRDKVKNIQIQQFARPDVYLAITMVHVAIRNYSEGNYWDYFIDEIGFDIPTVRKSQLGKAFVATLREYDLFEVAHEVGSNYAYVENIKAHAFVPNSYISGYLDFVFSFYDRNLSRYIDTNIEEELTEMIDFMGTTLSDKTDKIKLDKFEDNAPKSYKLLKATRQVIAQGPTYVVVENIINHLRMIDDYYYDDKYAVNNDRFSIAFNNWVRERESEINKGLTEKRRRNNSKYFKKPHFEIDRNNNLAYLVIPEQKIRNDEFNGSANVIITYNGNSKAVKLAMYRAYGTLVSEIVKIPIPDLFGEYDVTISSGKDRNFNIPARDVRIFDEDFNETNRLPKGHAYLLVKKGSKVNSEDSYVYANLNQPNWDEYSYEGISENTIIYINGQAYSILGSFVDKIEFKDILNDFDVTAHDFSVQSVYQHPELSFKVERESVKAVFIWCNDHKINVFENADAIIELPNDNVYLGVMLSLNKYVGKEDGFYNIYLDEPGKLKKALCNYVLISGLKYIPDRYRYIYSEYADVTIKGSYDLVPVNCEMLSENLFRLNLLESSEMLLNLLLNGVTYTLHINLPTFKYGFEKKWKVEKLDMLWHTDLKNDFYIHMPYATQAKISMNHKRDRFVYGEVVEENTFRFDLTTMAQIIQSSKSPFNYIDLHFFDNKWRSLPVYRVLNTLWIRRFILGMADSEIFIDVSYEGKSDIKVLVYENDTDNLVVEKYITQGKNLMPELTEDGLYRIERYESIQDDFGFGEELSLIMQPLYKMGIVNYNNLSNCKMFIDKIYHEDTALELDFRYTLYDLQMIDDFTYKGSLHGVMKENKKVLKSEKSIVNYKNPKFNKYYVGKEVEITLDVEDNKWYVSGIELIDDDESGCLYYDKKQRKLISWNDPILDSSKDIERFLYLDNDMIHMEVSFRRVK